MRRNITHLTLTGIGFALLLTVLPRPAQAEDYWRTYTYTRTFSEPMASTITTQRVIEQPAVIDRVIEKPVMIDRVVEKPVMIEKVVENPVVIDRQVETPVTIEKTIEHPVFLEGRGHLINLNLFDLLNLGLL